MKKDNKLKKDMYHIHDKSYKDLYSKKDIAADLFKSMIDAKWTEYIKPENLTLVNKSYITSDYEETEADIVYRTKINDNEVYFYILLEFQSSIDYRMPLRLLFYMCEILREHAVNARHKKYDKSIKIPAVVPIVLYNGDRLWDVPREFRKMIYNEELFGNNILNFKYDVFDISNDKRFEKDKLIASKNVTSAIFLLDQKMDALEFLERIKVIALYFNTLSDSEIKAIKNWIKNTVAKELAESAIKILEADKEDVELMVARNAFILDDWKEQGKKQGREEGIREGREEGIREGKEQGIELAKMIFKLSSNGHSNEEIAKECRISKEEVKKILE